MVCATEIYQWFKELSAHNRVDFIYNIMQLCLPSELRFFSTLLEDINNKDYANLREIEERSNSPNEFRQYPHTHLTEEIVHKLCLSLSLLKSTNQKVAEAIYEILRIHYDYAIQCMNHNNDFSSEILLMYAMASYHPAFTFNDKQKLSSFLETLLKNYKSNSNYLTKNTNNNNCSKNANIEYEFYVGNNKLTITDVKIDGSDAVISLKMESQYDHFPTSTNRVTKYSDIGNLISKVSEYCDSQPQIKTIGSIFNKLSKNGNFNTMNIKTNMTKILISLLQINSSVSDMVCSYFQQLPLYKLGCQEMHTCDENEIIDRKSSLSNYDSEVTLIPLKQEDIFNKSNDEIRKSAVVSVNSMFIEEEKHCEHDSCSNLNIYERKNEINATNEFSQLKVQAEDQCQYRYSSIDEKEFISTTPLICFNPQFIPFGYSPYYTQYPLYHNSIKPNSNISIPNTNNNNCSSNTNSIINVSNCNLLNTSSGSKMSINSLDSGSNKPPITKPNVLCNSTHHILTNQPSHTQFPQYILNIHPSSAQIPSSTPHYHPQSLHTHQLTTHPVQQNNNNNSNAMSHITSTQTSNQFIYPSISFTTPTLTNINEFNYDSSYQQRGPPMSMAINMSQQNFPSFLTNHNSNNTSNSNNTNSSSPLRNQTIPSHLHQVHNTQQQPPRMQHQINLNN